MVRPSFRLRADRGDEQLGEGLPVAALLGPAFLLLAEVDLLLVLAVGHDLALDRGAGDHRGADPGLALAAHHERLEGDLAAHLAGQQLDLEAVALGHAILLPAGLDHRVHRPLLECAGFPDFREAGLYDRPGAPVKEGRYYGASGVRPA